jgi:hypothetical protein
MPQSLHVLHALVRPFACCSKSCSKILVTCGGESSSSSSLLERSGIKPEKRKQEKKLEKEGKIEKREGKKMSQGLTVVCLKASQ